MSHHQRFKKGTADAKRNMARVRAFRKKLHSKKRKKTTQRKKRKPISFVFRGKLKRRIKRIIHKKRIHRRKTRLVKHSKQSGIDLGGAIFTLLGTGIIAGGILGQSETTSSSGGQLGPNPITQPPQPIFNPPSYPQPQPQPPQPMPISPLPMPNPTPTPSQPGNTYAPGASLRLSQVFRGLNKPTFTFMNFKPNTPIYLITSLFIGYYPSVTRYTTNQLIGRTDNNGNLTASINITIPSNASGISFGESYDGSNDTVIDPVPFNF